MSSPLSSPAHSRYPSNVDTSFVYTTTSDENTSPLASRRKSSLASQSSPGADYMQGLNGSVSMSSDLAAAGDPSNGLGNLADELADAWDEDEEEDGDGTESQDLETHGESMEGNTHNANGTQQSDGTRDSGVDVTSSPVSQKGIDGTASPSVDTTRSRHRRQRSRYDGSEYGENSETESLDGISVGLEACMSSIERLAQPSDGSGTGVVSSVLTKLKDLGSQTGIENGTSRLITAHAALTSHLAHQTRTVHTLTYPLLSPLSYPFLDEAFIDDLLPLITSVGSRIPQPASSALGSLSQLSTLTTDLIQTLNYLSDTLQMSRQTTTTATRRLRGARELVAEMRREMEAREEGIRWIDREGWQTRLAQRECAGVCRDVVGGFEEVCQSWRDRLVRELEVGAS